MCVVVVVVDDFSAATRPQPRVQELRANHEAKLQRTQSGQLRDLEEIFADFLQNVYWIKIA